MHAFQVLPKTSYKLPEKKGPEKLAEKTSQQNLSEQQKAKRQHREEKIDNAVEESFPASDPPAY